METASCTTHSKQSEKQPLNVASQKKLFLEDNIGFIELLEVFGDDLTIVNAARVSFHKESGFEEVIDESGEKKQTLCARDIKLIHKA